MCPVCTQLCVVTTKCLVVAEHNLQWHAPIEFVCYPLLGYAASSAGMRAGCAPEKAT